MAHTFAVANDPAISLASTSSTAALCFTLPRADHDLLYWMNRAAALFTKQPDRYRLTIDQARTLALLAQQFQDARHRCILTSRTAEDTLAKNRARDAARAAFLPVIQFIKANVEIDLDAKYKLGCKPAKASKQPIAPPQSFPYLSIIGAGDGTHTLSFCDSDSPTRRRKPKGAQWLDLQILMAPPGVGPLLSPITQTAPEGVLIRQERITRSPFTITHDCAGMNGGAWTATYFGRWMTATGKPGPWSFSVAMMIAFVIKADFAAHAASRIASEAGAMA